MKWLAEVFASSFVRKLAYIAAALLVANLIGHRAHAQTFSYPAFTTTAGPVSQAATGQAWCNAWLALEIPFRVNQGGAVQTGVTATPPGVPTTGSQLLTCVTAPDSIAQTNHSAASTLACSSSSGNLDLLTTVGGGVGYTAGGGYCVNGCEYTNGNFAVTFGGGAQRLAGKAVPTGVACGVSGTTTSSQAPSTNQSCQVKAGVTVCIDSADGVATQQNAPGGTFSVISPNVPSTPQTCAGYADGGIACNTGTTGVMQTPPGPSTAASTVAPATPTTVVQASPGNIVNYYSPATAAASKGPVSLGVGSGGNPAGTTTATGTGTGTSGTGSSAANGDCGASSVDCSGDQTLPDLTRSDTIQSNVQSYLDSIKASPLFSALTTVSTSWPTGSCPSTPFTVFGKDVDFMTSACSIWTTDVSTPLGFVFLAIWAIWGIRVVLSA